MWVQEEGYARLVAEIHAKTAMSRSKARTECATGAVSVALTRREAQESGQSLKHQNIPLPPSQDNHAPNDWFRNLEVGETERSTRESNVLS